MDKLNNITRVGGYPLVAEGVEILSKHEDFITAIMDGMRISSGFSKTAVVLQYTNDMQGVLQEATIYYIGGLVKMFESQRGKLLRLVGDGTTKLSDLIDGTVSKTITIQQTDYIVTDGGTTYPNAYSTVTAQLTTPQGFLDAVNFCYLKSPETEKAKDYVNSISNIVCSVNGNNSSFGLALNTSQQNFIRKSNRKIEIQLSLVKNAMNFNPNITLAEVSFSETILSDNGIYPINCLYHRSKNNIDSYQHIGSVWQNNKLKVFIPADDGSNTDIFDTILISGVILL